MSPSILKVDASRLRSLAGQLNQLAAGLTAGSLDVPAGPAWQPSAAAAGQVSTGIDHVDGECAQALTEFGSTLIKAADAYEATDAAGATALSQTMPGR